MIVWAGGSDLTIYGDREANYAFRAWHDWCYWRNNLDHSMAGEITACRMQCGHIVQLYGLLPVRLTAA